MSRAEQPSFLERRFPVQERESGGAKTKFAIGTAAIALFGTGLAMGMVDQARHSVNVGAESSVTEPGFGTVLDVAALPPATRYARAIVGVEGVEVQSQLVADVNIDALGLGINLDLAPPGEARVIYRDTYSAPQGVDLLVGGQGAITRSLDLDAGTGTVEVDEDAFSATTYEMLPNSGHNLRAGRLFAAWSGLGAALEPWNEDWDLGTNSMEGRVGGIAVLQAHRIATECLKVVAPEVKEVLTESIAEDTANLINQLNPTLSEPATADDITVKMPDIATVSIENQYADLIEEMNQKAAADSFTLVFPELPSSDEICEGLDAESIANEANKEVFNQFGPAIKERLEEAA